MSKTTTKYVYQLTDFLHQVMNPKTKEFVETDNLLSFQNPDVEAGIQELQGFSGLMGTLEITDWANIGALEFGLTYAGLPDDALLLMNPDKQEHKLYWAEAYTDKSGEVNWNSYSIYFTGVLKNIPGGEGKKGENAERQFKYAVKTYKLSRNGEVLFDYDPANDIIKFGTRNFGAEIKSAVLGE